MTHSLAPKGTRASARVLGTLHAEGTSGVVRLQDRYDTGPADLWDALTDPARLARWLGEVHGDLRVGGEFEAHFLASGWEGTGRVEECDPPHRLRVSTRSSDQPDGILEVTLTPDGDGTVLVLEDRGVPLEQVAAYGAGDQIHLEDLASYLAGGGRCEPRSRWQQLHGLYERLPVTPADGA
jgi:uncharacterized protein YndB with AHSA1/START domain